MIPVGYEFETGYYAKESGEEVLFWEPLPITFARFGLDPTSDRAIDILKVQLAVHAGMNAFTYALSGQGYRTLTGIGFEAVTGIKPVQAAAVAAPVIAATVSAVTYEKYVNEPIRDSHGGSSGTWFGPYASGFGSVV